eukprot:5320345-Heterocapsa_arctica.AAC.1
MSSGNNEDEPFPGVSSQKRVKPRAEQLFIEAQAIQMAQKDSAEQKKTRELYKDDKTHMVQKNAKKSRTDT